MNKDQTVDRIHHSLDSMSQIMTQLNKDIAVATNKVENLCQQTHSIQSKLEGEIDFLEKRINRHQENYQQLHDEYLSFKSSVLAWRWVLAGAFGIAQLILMVLQLK